MSNTAIITQDNGAINSKEFWGFALKTERVRDSVDSDEELLATYLIACRDHNDGNVSISIFYGDDGLEEACVALQNLLGAIQNGDRIWDVFDYNSNL